MNEIEKAIVALNDIHEGWSSWVPQNGSLAHRNLQALGIAIDSLREKQKCDKGCWTCNDARRTGCTNMGSRIYIEKNEDGYVISDRFDNTVEVYCCPKCGKRLEEHNDKT